MAFWHFGGFKKLYSFLIFFSIPLIHIAQQPDTTVANDLLAKALQFADQYQFDSALKVYEAASLFAKDHQLQEQELIALTGLTKSWRKKGEIDTAEQLITETIDRFTAILGEDHILLGPAYYQLGVLGYFRQDHPASRKSYWKQRVH